jgi:hypothetical protein
MVPGEIESADVKERERIAAAPPSRERPEEPPGPGGSSGATALSGPLRAGLGAAIALCLAATALHVLLVFLHVAPLNPVSTRFSRQINGWVFPLFEQNWRLFAPDPESVNQQVSARSEYAGPDGTPHASPWVDLTAVDDAAVEHNPLPSHTTQNMLRRAWSSYLDSHGGDDEPHSDRAVMTQKYLRNIAVRRVEGRYPGAVRSIQLRVVTRPIAAPGAAANRPMTAAQVAAETRTLPWWKVTPDGN